MRSRRLTIRGTAGFTAIVLIALVAALPSAAQSVNDEPPPERPINDDRGTGFLKVRGRGTTVDVSLEGNRPGHSIVGPGLPVWLRQCTWRELGHEEFVQLIHSVSGVPGSLTEGAEAEDPWMVVFCPAGPEADLATGDRWLFASTGILEAWQTGGRPPQRFLDWIVARSYASVALPVQIGDAAPFGDHDAPLITQLPTWLWIDPAVWAPVSVTPAPVFGVTATVTATPRRVVFENGDDLVDCGANLGPPYDFTRDEEDQHSDCTLTYHHTSAVGDWTLTSTIWWEVTYACTAWCGTGRLPDLVISNTRDVRVAELQAVLLAPTPTPASN